jgi:hypothetical protein
MTAYPRETKKAQLLYSYRLGIAEFQYVSKDLDGEEIPVTGFIAFPYASRLNGHVYPYMAVQPAGVRESNETGNWNLLAIKIL